MTTTMMTEWKKLLAINWHRNIRYVYPTGSRGYCHSISSSLVWSMHPKLDEDLPRVAWCRKDLPRNSKLSNMFKVHCIFQLEFCSTGEGRANHLKWTRGVDGAICPSLVTVNVGGSLIRRIVYQVDAMPMGCDALSGKYFGLYFSAH